MSRLFYPYPTRQELASMEAPPLPGARVTATMLTQRSVLFCGRQNLKPQREPVSPIMSAFLYSLGCVALLLIFMSIAGL
jgi:hypothetical protein